MELVVHIHDRETLAAALEQDVGGVAARLPRNPDSRVLAELKEWRAAAGKRGRKFYLIWDWLVREEELPGIADIFAAVARLDPDGVQLRDLGLVGEGRRRYPHLALQAAGNWGAHNSPGVRLAESLGFTRVVVEGPISLPDLALLRRQTTMPLAVTLSPLCRGTPSLCLLEESLGISCEACCLSRPENVDSGTLMTSLEMFSGLCQLGIEAVQIRGELFSLVSLGQVIRLYLSIKEASPMERPRVLAAAREVLAAFGQMLRLSPPLPNTSLNLPGPPQRPIRREPKVSSRPGFSGRSRIWVEVRDYAEAVALSREWREPLLLALTPDTYAAFLKDHRHWTPRRLVWRLPLTIPESALFFYQKALETLRQGDYNRFVAGDWGAVALVREAGGQVYGDQTLGVRNSRSLKIAREFRVQRVCLPPGHRPEHWQEILRTAPSGSFWSYLYQAAPLAVCSAPATALPPSEDLHWILEDGKSLLCPKIPQDVRNLDSWFKQQGIFPLMVALPHSPLPRGQLPSWLGPRPQSPPAGK